MAIQQLTQPIINPISAFDSKKAHIISFIVIGGAQVIGNRLVIRDNQTGKEIYNKIQSTMKLEHLIPANTLINGGYYNAVVYTIDSANNESVASTAVPFYCYSQPNLTIDNIPATETIENGTYRFIGSYLQKENELLNSYQYTLYDSNKNILSQSSLIYYDTDSSLSYTFVGMSNDTAYYIELSGETVNGTKITSGLKYFTVRYLQPASFAICDLVNNCENGYIQISSNIVAIDGKSNPDPPIYIDDKEVDLRDPDSWVEWNSGFRIQDDFTMRVWGRDFTPYENIITLSNDLSSSNNPNKIEMKWMIGDTIKKLPTYKDVNGYNVNLKDSQRAPIKNLSIKGETRQKTDSGRVINEGEGYVTLEPADGKNKVDFINYVETIFDSSKVERLSDGSYKFKHCDTVYTLFEGLLKAPCTLSWYARNDGTTTTGAPTFNFKIFYEDGTAKTLFYTTSPDFSLKTKVLTKNVIKIVNTYIGTSPLTIIKDVQLEEGSKATSYEPFGYIPSNDFPCNISIIPGGNSIQETREESKSTVTGTEVTVNDTYINNQTKFNIDGNSYQETTQGYNLYNIDEALNDVLKKNDDSSYTFTRTSSRFAKAVNISIPANTDFVIDYSNVKLNGNYEGKILSAVIKYTDDTDTTSSLYSTEGDSRGLRRYSKDIKSIQLYLESSVTEGTSITFSDFMIYLGSSLSKAYEPYTGGIPSPSPDYPQEITSVGGYDNIFDKNNIISGSYVSDSNGAFNANSTSKRTDYIEIQANSYYYIYSDKTSGNWGAWYDKDKKFISGITLGGQKEGTVNSPANAKYIAFTISYQGNLTDYSNIKINETVIKIKQSGKNWFDNTLKGYGHYGAIAKTIPTGVRLSVNEDVTASDYRYGVFATINLSNYVGKTVKMKATIKSNSNLRGTYTIGLCNSNGTNRKPKEDTATSEKIISFVVPDLVPEQEYLCIWFYCNNGGSGVVGDYVDYTNVIITIDNEDMTYEPYHEPIITPINLQGNILSKVGDVKDVLKINRNGEVEIKKNIEKIVLTGSEKLVEKSSSTTRTYWGIDFSNYGIYQYDDSTKTCDILTTKFKSRPQQGPFLPGQVALITGKKNVYFIFEPDTTEEQARAILTDMPVYFRLAEPQTIKLSSISPIELWQGTNIFSLVTNLDTEIELEYNYIPQSPSPEAPSEIKNIGNNINILNKNNISVTSGVKTEILETGIRLIDIAQSIYEYAGISLGGKELLSKNITCYYDALKNKNIYSNVELFFGTASRPTSGGLIQKQIVTSSITWKVPSDFPNGSDQISIYLYISGGNPPSSGYSVDFTNLKVEIGDTPTDYSPYGLGNISTVISNKNVFNLKRLIEMSTKYSEIENGYKFLAETKMYSKGISCLYPISLPISMSYKIQNLTGTGFRFKFWFDNGKTESLNAYSSGTSSEETNIVINNYTKSRCETNCKNRY